MHLKILDNGALKQFLNKNKIILVNSHLGRISWKGKADVQLNDEIGSYYGVTVKGCRKGGCGSVYISRLKRCYQARSGWVVWSHPPPFC